MIDIIDIMAIATPFTFDDGGDVDDGTGPGWFALSRPMAADDDGFERLTFPEDDD